MAKQPPSKRIQSLYQKLPSGRSSRSSEDIAANQLERLQGAMIHAIFNRGYQNTTVADIIALAGVARRTFYEHFANKEECFLATYDAVLKRTMARVADAYGSPGDWEVKIQASFLAFVEEVIANPEAAELVMIHSASAGKISIERRNRGVGAFERLIRDSFADAPAYREISELTVKAIVGGIRHIVYSRLRQGRAIELPGLVPDLVAWAGTYRNPVALEAPPGKARKRRPGRGGEEPPAKPSRGRQAYPRSFIIHNQRERILEAVANISASKGYGELTVPEIARTAGVSHKTFYQHFPNKDQAFAATYELVSQEAMSTSVGAFAAETDWPRAVHAGMAALVHYMAGEPALTRLALVEVLSAGPAFLARRDQSLQGFSIMLTAGRGYPDSWSEMPEIVPEAISGGILEILYFGASTGRLGKIPRLVDELTYIALAPFIGPGRAAKTASESLH